jgi:hypothetical protein
VLHPENEMAQKYSNFHFSDFTVDLPLNSIHCSGFFNF